MIASIPVSYTHLNGVDFLLEGMVVDVVSDASTETVLFADVPVKVDGYKRHTLSLCGD